MLKRIVGDKSREVKQWRIRADQTGTLWPDADVIALMQERYSEPGAKPGRCATSTGARDCRSTAIGRRLFLYGKGNRPKAIVPLWIASTLASKQTKASVPFARSAEGYAVPQALLRQGRQSLLLMDTRVTERSPTSTCSRWPMPRRGRVR